MRVLFFCSSLEPGRDGVGDYCRMLAEALGKDGHACSLLALNDAHRSEAVEQETQEGHILRLPATLSWKEKQALATQYINAQAPDWLSWHFVPYGYDPKGILSEQFIGLIRALPASRRHLMVHETWIALYQGAPLKERLVGWLQRLRAMKALRSFAPGCVHTSNPSYQTALENQGLPTRILPLFGNIRIHKVDTGPRHDAELRALLFGTLHPQWDPLPTARWLDETGRTLGRKPVVHAAGRMGSHAPELLKILRTEGISVVERGELPEAGVSRLIQESDLGIVPHPWELIGKSGVASAMLDHGLPVMVPRDDWQPRLRSTKISKSDPLLLKLQDADATRTAKWLASKRPPASSLPRVAAQLIRDLSAA